MSRGEVRGGVRGTLGVKRRKGLPGVVLPMYIWTAAFVLLPLLYIVAVSFMTPDKAAGKLRPAG